MNPTKVPDVGMIVLPTICVRSVGRWSPIIDVELGSRMPQVGAGGKVRVIDDLEQQISLVVHGVYTGLGRLIVWSNLGQPVGRLRMDDTGYTQRTRYCNRCSEPGQ